MNNLMDPKGVKVTGDRVQLKGEDHGGGTLRTRSGPGPFPMVPFLLLCFLATMTLKVSSVQPCCFSSPQVQKAMDKTAMG